MNKKTSKLNRKSCNRIGDALASINTETKYLTPIFGTLTLSIRMIFLNSQELS